MPKRNMAQTTDPSILRQNRPAGARAAVCFCCDRRYLPYAAFAAGQIADLHPERAFDIILAGSEPLPDLPLLTRYGVRTLEIDMGNRFDGLRLDSRRTSAVYLRLALPGLLAKEYDRLLYLDSDIFVARSGIDRLLAVDMGGRAIGAVRDNTQWRTPARRPEQYRRFGWPSGPYFNSGMLLMDCDMFGEADLMDRCITFGQTHKDRLIGHDQTLLNCVLRGAWAEMSPRWNWQFTWASWIYALSEDARILHFIGPNKPWADRSGHFPQTITRPFHEFLTDHFPDTYSGGPPASPLRDGPRLTKSLLKHTASRKKMAAYLARFPDDYTFRDPALP